MKILSGVFFMLLWLALSCTEKESVLPDLGLEFFPLRVGNYSIYQVSETRISQSIETKFSYEIKVTIADSVVSNNREVTYFLHREKRETPSGSWEGITTWSAQVIHNRVLQNEGNILFVKLLFPPSLNLNWNGNQFNNLPDNGEIFYDGDDTPYVISAMNQSISLDTGINSEDALTIIQNERNDIFTGVDERREIYARNVGLILKEVTQLKYCTANSCYGQQKIDQGVILIQSLKEYGKL